MPNQKKRKQAGKNLATNFSDLKDFFSFYTPEEARQYLWDMFHYSMVTDERGPMEAKERGEAFFFYKQLLELIRSSATLTGVK